MPKKPRGLWKNTGTCRPDRAARSTAARGMHNLGILGSENKSTPCAHCVKILTPNVWRRCRLRLDPFHSLREKLSLEDHLHQSLPPAMDYCFLSSSSFWSVKGLPPDCKVVIHASRSEPASALASLVLAHAAKAAKSSMAP